MKAIALTLAMVTAAAALPAVALVQLHATPTAEAAPARTWQLVQFYQGDALVIDHNLTHDDCDDALPRDQVAKGLRFSCEVEG